MSRGLQVLFLIVLLIDPVAILSQQSMHADGEPYLSFIDGDPPEIVLDSLNNDSLIVYYHILHTRRQYIFAEGREVSINFLQYASNKKLGNGHTLRQLKITSPGAKGIRIILKPLQLSSFSRLYLSANPEIVHSEKNRILPTGNRMKAMSHEVAGESAIITLYEPKFNYGNNTVIIEKVNHRFK